jgi:hypothetical protein
LLLERYGDVTTIINGWNGKWTQVLSENSGEQIARQKFIVERVEGGPIVDINISLAYGPSYMSGDGNEVPQTVREGDVFEVSTDIHPQGVEAQITEGLNRGNDSATVVAKFPSPFTA